ncbi:holo-[acyl-carrier-protein] synthase [Ktedonobacter sp. SOSP1-52]|uniref:holo-ACP synthase n=1 Tax=Ktedonobacter sp. SOSP1-52 TaxID=2778366 RepID=UPI0019169C1A|nr:holo-ACP synthase [Ktedonobacter sp. SOSP1-52]GHO70630.1 holo-[acyl-carrier-protein] synthase [Ktedonobacter sp. SOSP1-52]
MQASPYRVGIDLVPVKHIQESIERFGKIYLNTLFTEEEQAYCCSHTSSQAVAQSFAVRFAAKEATVKILRPEPFWGDWREIEVRRAPDGACDIVLHSTAAELAEQRGIYALSLSMSHEIEYATAIVIADLVSS